MESETSRWILIYLLKKETTFEKSITDAMDKKFDGGDSDNFNENSWTHRRKV